MAYVTARIFLQGDTLNETLHMQGSGESAKAASKKMVSVMWERQHDADGQHREGRFLHEIPASLLTEITNRIANEEGLNNADMPTEGVTCLPGNPFYVAP